jgi:RimJ/RimL family protein N-acetyltransferase
MDISLCCIDEEDLLEIARLANDADIAAMTNNLPHPYTPEHARTWYDYVQSHDSEHVFKICGDGSLMGVIGLVHETEHDRAELGYWLGKAYWNRGVMSAAVPMALAYAFGVLCVRRVYARCYAANAASRRILERNGFISEGCQRQHHECMGVVHDLMCYGLLVDEYTAAANNIREGDNK